MRRRKLDLDDVLVLAFIVLASTLVYFGAQWLVAN
jgi:hypothetical protein